MIRLLKQFFLLFDLDDADFRMWEKEMAAPEDRLTSSPWIGWYWVGQYDKDARD